MSNRETGESMTATLDVTLPPDQTDIANRFVHDGLAAIKARAASSLPKQDIPGVRTKSMYAYRDYPGDNDW